MTKTKKVVSSRDSSIVPAFAALAELGTGVEDGIPGAKTYPPRTQLVREGEKPQWVGLVQSGILKLNHGGEDGRSVIIGVRSKGWWLNSNSVMLGIPSQYTVTTSTKCTIALVAISDWTERLVRDHSLLYQVVYSQAQELAMLEKRIILRETSAESRLIHLENETTMSIWKTLSLGTVLKHGEVAELLSVSSEHLSRIKSKRMAKARRKPSV